MRRPEHRVQLTLRRSIEEVPATPLSVELSRLLLAFTIEFDNEFEQRMTAALRDRPFRVSVVMWSNFLRFVGDGISVGELPTAAALPTARVLSTLGGMERWRYVDVVSAGTRKQAPAKRDGFGSARGLRSEWVVRPTEVGRTAQELWPPLFGEIEKRWRARFGRASVDELERTLRDVVDALDAVSTEYLPVVMGTNGMRSEVAGCQEPSDPVPLLALLAQTLLAYTLEFEREAPVSLPLAETVIDALDQHGSNVRNLPAETGLSPEAVSMALTYLKKHGYVHVAKKTARLTALGVRASGATPLHHARVAACWTNRLGRSRLAGLRTALHAILEQRDGDRPRLAMGLTPPPGAWRAEPRYRARTEAMLTDPSTGLPRHPVVLHRGGWPDGS